MCLFFFIILHELDVFFVEFRIFLLLTLHCEYTYLCHFEGVNKFINLIFERKRETVNLSSVSRLVVTMKCCSQTSGGSSSGCASFVVMCSTSQNRAPWSCSCWLVFRLHERLGLNFLDESSIGSAIIQASMVFWMIGWPTRSWICPKHRSFQNRPATIKRSTDRVSAKFRSAKVIPSELAMSLQFNGAFGILSVISGLTR